MRKSRIAVGLASLSVGLAGVAGLGINVASAGSTSGQPAPPSTSPAVPKGPADGKIKGVNPGADATNQRGFSGEATGVHGNKPSGGLPSGDDLIAAGTGGCVPGYGKGQCLPYTPPDAAAMGMSVQQMPWTCDQVRKLFPQGIVVAFKGQDPAHLDSNGDGTACGTGDS